MSLCVSAAAADEEEEEEEDDLLRRTGNFVASSESLPSGILRVGEPETSELDLNQCSVEKSSF